MKTAKETHTFNSLHIPLFSKKAGQSIVIQSVFLITTKHGGVWPM